MDCNCEVCVKEWQREQKLLAEERKELSERERYIAHFKPFMERLAFLGFGELFGGGFRKGFIRDKIVIKVPRGRDGEIDNLVEARAWHKYKNNPTSLGFYLAPCRILENGCLMMVTVDTAVRNHPEWVKKMHDGYQVGYYKERVVAYDYALEIPERVQWEDEWGFHSDFFQKEWVRKPAFQRVVA